jgi:hypothetical protein
MEDFDWIKDIKASIILKPNKTYYIECGYGFDETIIRNAFDKLFGVDVVNHSIVGRFMSCINLFDNDYMNRAEGPITFYVRYGGEFIKTGWNLGDSFQIQFPGAEFIPMEDFINYCVIRE